MSIMLYRAIHTIEGEIRIATYVNDETDTVAESAAYAAQGLYVCPITEAQYPDAVEAVNDDSWHITYADITEAPVFTESPPRPGLYYDFDFDTHTWIISAERLTQAKADKNAALMNEYNLRINVPYTDGPLIWNSPQELLARARGLVHVLEYTSSFPLGGYWDGFHDDSGAAVGLPATWSQARDYANGYIYNIETRNLKCLSARYAHQAAIAGFATIEDTIAYNITTGWPA